ncbi:MAG: cell division protein FtsA [Elusimicrobia bacterium]|nr:cell division protein FtsA [Elusimicrobiota bacterium]
MAKNDLIAGLDVGSGRVACVIGEPNPDGQGMRILSGSSAACRGVKGGIVLNISETSRSIRQAVEKAEEEAKQLVQGVFLGVRGKHLESVNNRGAYNIARTDKEITQEDVKAVIGNARAISISGDREILHTIPQGFSLDRQRGVPDPVGMEGALLEVEVHIVTASISHLNNLSKAVAEAGFDVLQTVYNPVALGELIVTPEERELGCLLLDLGAQSISLAIYGEGSIKFTKELPVGAEFITRDIAHALRTNMLVAEKIKIERGVAHPRFAGDDGAIDYVGVDGRIARTIKTSAMNQVILPRVEEIFTLISNAVQDSPFADIAQAGGAILSGGGSMLRGMPEAAEQVLAMPARPGLVPPGSIAGDERFFDPAFASAISLVCYPNTGMFESLGRGDGRHGEARWMKGIRRIFQDMF